MSFPPIIQQMGLLLCTNMTSLTVTHKVALKIVGNLVEITSGGGGYIIFVPDTQSEQTPNKSFNSLQFNGFVRLPMTAQDDF